MTHRHNTTERRDTAERRNTSRRAERFERQQVIELLPWLLNDTLEADERTAVLRALREDESLQAELDAAAEIFLITDEPLSTMTLAEYGLGLDSAETPRPEIEAHLAASSSSRAELELVQADTVVDFEQAARSRRGRSGTISAPQRTVTWRQLAAAAALVVAAGALTAPRLLDRDAGSQVNRAEVHQAAPADAAV
ncbi:MAG: hypothetical protein AAF725_27050, partial [Acidobacteriota bacterium]